MKPILILSLLLFSLPTFLLDFKKDKLIILASLSNYGCDFDGDKLGDLAVWDPHKNTLYFQLTSDNKFYVKKFFDGELSYDPVFADYDGDGKTDFVFYQVDSGQWISYLSSQPGMPHKMFLGAVSDHPVPVSLYTPKKYDIAVWRPNAGVWALPIVNQQEGSPYSVHYQGGASDSAFAADYDGDGKSDLGIWREETGFWYIDKSTTQYNPNQGESIQHGTGWDIIVPNDYDADGKCDLVFWRPQDQTWYFIYSSNQSKNNIKFGDRDDIPSSNDLNGDGVPELIMWNMNKKSWNILNLKTQQTYSYKWEVPDGSLSAISVLEKYE